MKCALIVCDTEWRNCSSSEESGEEHLAAADYLRLDSMVRPLTVQDFQYLTVNENSPPGQHGEHPHKAMALSLPGYMAAAEYLRLDSMLSAKKDNVPAAMPGRGQMLCAH